MYLSPWSGFGRDRVDAKRRGKRDEVVVVVGGADADWILVVIQTKDEVRCERDEGKEGDGDGCPMTRLKYGEGQSQYVCHEEYAVLVKTWSSECLTTPVPLAHLGGAGSRPPRGGAHHTAKHQMRLRWCKNTMQNCIRITWYGVNSYGSVVDVREVSR